MAHFLPGLPGADEYSAAFAGYVSEARGCADPIAALEDQMVAMLALLRRVDSTKRLYRYGPDKWSVQQVLGHIIDVERIFAYRALRIARADKTPLPGFEENDYVVAAEAERCDWNSLVAEFECVRQASILLLKHLPDSAWTRRGTSSGATLSVRALAHIMVGHTEHHVTILRERYLL